MLQTKSKKVNFMQCVSKPKFENPSMNKNYCIYHYLILKISIQIKIFNQLTLIRLLYHNLVEQNTSLFYSTLNF